MKAANSAVVTGALGGGKGGRATAWAHPSLAKVESATAGGGGPAAMRTGVSPTAWAHFSLSKTKPSAAVEPSRQRPPGTSTSPGHAPARGAEAPTRFAGAGQPK